MIDHLILKVKKTPAGRKLLHIYRKITFTNAVSIPQIRSVKIKRSKYGFKRINLLVPSINEEHFFGGTSTALKLLDTIIDKITEDIRIRIIITDAKPKKDALENFRAYQYKPAHVDDGANKQLMSLGLDIHPEIFVTPQDRFISTAWWTAYKAINIVDQQIALFGSKNKRLLYLIQDFEPGFYQWSSHYALAESTYRSDIPIIAVFNSSFLKDYFSNNNYDFFKEYVFEPRLNSELKKRMSGLEKKRKKKILIYGRPSVDRNCFPLIIESLRKWACLQPDHKNWNIVSIGEDHPSIDIGNNQLVKSMGKLSLSEYAKILKESAIGIALMISPHPSYPPFEMAHFGLLTLTNIFPQKTCHNITKISFHMNVSLRK